MEAAPELARQPIAAAPPAACREDAAEVLCLAFGAGVLTALREGFLRGGDLMGVAQLLWEGDMEHYKAWVDAQPQRAAGEPGRIACAAPVAGTEGATPHLVAAWRRRARVGALSPDWVLFPKEVTEFVFGVDVLAALEESFRDGGDFTHVVALLLDASAKPHLATAMRAALVRACDGGRAGAAGLLLGGRGVQAVDAGAASAHVDAAGEGGYSLLAAAADRGDVAVVRVLVGSGKADVNDSHTNGYLPLVMAANSGHVECIAALLAGPGISVNKVDGEGDTALTIAAHWGRVASVAALVAADGINVNKPGSELNFGRKSALMCAAEKGHIGCLRVLLAADGIDVNQTERRGETALIIAVHNRRAGCTHALLAQQGIAINHTDDGGYTALGYAAYYNHTEIARALVAVKGVDLNHITMLGWYVNRTVSLPRVVSVWRSGVG